jgi:hypothetical protein
MGCKALYFSPIKFRKEVPLPSSCSNRPNKKKKKQAVNGVKGASMFLRNDSGFATRLHGVTFQKIVLVIVTALRTSTPNRFGCLRTGSVEIYLHLRVSTTITKEISVW